MINQNHTYEKMRQLHVDCQCECYDNKLDNCCFERASAPYKYRSKIKTTFNCKSSETRYFVEKCDEWVRVARADYFERLAVPHKTVHGAIKTIKGVMHTPKTIYFN